MKTSLLITTYNTPHYLRLTLLTAFQQKVKPDEIVVADDGSGKETEQLIAEMKDKAPVPLVHVWHEDDGFRRCTILNKAIAKCKGDYIIQVDGDVVMGPHFIEDHLHIARQGHWVSGSRVLLPSDITQRIFQKAAEDKTGKKLLSELSFWRLPLGFALNSLRCRPLCHYMATRYARKVDHVRGCNMAYWRNDAIRINGYNENLTEWGHEDGEFVYRLHFSGIKKLSLKFGGCNYHLYHKPASRDNEHVHLKALEKVKKEKLTWCHNGIEQHLTQNL